MIRHVAQVHRWRCCCLLNCLAVLACVLECVTNQILIYKFLHRIFLRHLTYNLNVRLSPSYGTHWRKTKGILNIIKPCRRWFQSEVRNAVIEWIELTFKPRNVLFFPLFAKKKKKKSVNKLVSRKVVGIVSVGCQLVRTVGLLAVRLNLAKLRWKKCKKKCFFYWNTNLYFQPKKIILLAGIMQPLIRMRNVIPRWARN